jgi:hypothetical protein
MIRKPLTPDEVPAPAGILTPSDFDDSPQDAWDGDPRDVLWEASCRMAIEGVTATDNELTVRSPQEVVAGRRSRRREGTHYPFLHCNRHGIRANGSYYRCRELASMSSVDLAHVAESLGVFVRRRRNGRLFLSCRCERKLLHFRDKSRGRVIECHSLVFLRTERNTWRFEPVD